MVEELKIISEKLNKLHNDFLSLCDDIVQNKEELIIELNQTQLAEGRRSDGSFMPPYKEVTLQIKEQNGGIIKGELIALIDRGDFWKGMRVEAFDGIVSIYSTDWKSEGLQAEYSPEILGLTEENIMKVKEILLPLIREQIKMYFK